MSTKTQQIFQNSANLQLRGNTYDATHLDKFLSSGFGEKGLGTNVTATFQASMKREIGAQNGATPNNAASGDQLA